LIMTAMMESGSSFRVMYKPHVVSLLAKVD
jgi:hypothetical protein